MTQEIETDNFPEPFINNISEPLENNTSENSKNVLVPFQNLENSNVNTLNQGNNQENQNNLNSKIASLKVLCIIMLIGLIIGEIMIEISAGDDNESDKNKNAVEEDCEDYDGKDKCYVEDWSDWGIFFCSFFSNSISIGILGSIIHNGMPIIKIITSIILCALKELILLGIKEESSNDDYIYVTITTIIFFIITISYLVAVKIIAKFPG